jgi:hypothetical protein
MTATLASLKAWWERQRRVSTERASPAHQASKASRENQASKASRENQASKASRENQASKASREKGEGSERGVMTGSKQFHKPRTSSESSPGTAVTNDDVASPVDQNTQARLLGFVNSLIMDVTNQVKITIIGLDMEACKQKLTDVKVDEVYNTVVNSLTTDATIKSIATDILEAVSMPEFPYIKIIEKVAQQVATPIIAAANDAWPLLLKNEMEKASDVINGLEKTIPKKLGVGFLTSLVFTVGIGNAITLAKKGRDSAMQNAVVTILEKHQKELAKIIVSFVKTQLHECPVIPAVEDNALPPVGLAQSAIESVKDGANQVGSGYTQILFYTQPQRATKKIKFYMDIPS